MLLGLLVHLSVQVLTALGGHHRDVETHMHMLSTVSAYVFLRLCGVFFA